MDVFFTNCTEHLVSTVSGKIFFSSGKLSCMTLCVCVCVCVYTCGVGIEPWILHMLGKCCTTEPHPQPTSVIFMAVIFMVVSYALICFFLVF
jgi:hypothetical protein